MSQLTAGSVYAEIGDLREMRVVRVSFGEVNVAPCAMFPAQFLCRARTVIPWRDVVRLVIAGCTVDCVAASDLRQKHSVWLFPDLGMFHITSMGGE